MKTRKHSASQHDGRSIAGRIGHFYRFFNRQDWARCFDYIDPKIRSEGKVQLEDYAEGMSLFFEEYGPLSQIQLLKISAHPGGASRLDPRDFAYVVISWKDKSNQFHHFRERWIKDGVRWYTRVVGLVAGHPE